MNEDCSAVHLDAMPTRNGSEAYVGAKDFFSEHFPCDYYGISCFVLHGENSKAVFFLQFQSPE